VLVAYSLRGTIYVSPDQGETWTPLPPALPVALTACVRTGDGHFLIAAASGHLLNVGFDQNAWNAMPQSGAPWPLAGISLTAGGQPIAVGWRGIWRAGSQ